MKTTSIKEIKGNSEKTQKLFEKVGVSTVGDLIRYYPRGYDVYEDPVPISEVEEGKGPDGGPGLSSGRVQVSGNRNMQVTTIHVKDLTGTIKAVWFRMPFLRNTLAGAGRSYLEAGLQTARAALRWSTRKSSIRPGSMRRRFTRCSRSMG